ncbi:MAG: DUF2007 domain-containing protein [Candidatus Cloacimonetes bacterium]|nr:DUF2007 domain-containing protein [Candidatus Cloacimonadota bacterium]
MLYFIIISLIIVVLFRFYYYFKDKIKTNNDQESFEYIKYVEILETNNPSDIAIVKSILSTYEIIYYFKGEHLTPIRPAIETAKLMVNIEQVDEAKEVLKDLKLNYMVFNFSNSESEE